MLPVLGIWLSALLMVILAALSLVWRPLFWRQLGVPVMNCPLPLVGDVAPVVLGRYQMGELLHHCYKRGHGHQLIGLFCFDQPLLLVRDPVIASYILSTDFSSFVNRNFHLSPDTDPLVGRGLLALRGNRWRQTRMRLTPTFTLRNMRNLFHVVDYISRQLTLYVETTAAKHTEAVIELREMSACFMTDIVGMAFLGIESESLRDNTAPLRVNLKQQMHFSNWRYIKLMLAFLAPKLRDFLRLSISVPEVDNFIRDVVCKVLEYRKRHKVKHGDLLDILMKVQKRNYMTDEMLSVNKNTNESIASRDPHFWMDNEDIVAQVFIFLVAGFETSSSTMMFTLYELAQHPDVQDKLRHNIVTSLSKHDGKMTYDAILEMTYLHMVIAETLRLYPPLPFIDREVTKDYVIPGTGIGLPKGMGVVVSLLGLHRDALFWDNPEEFVPERFNRQKQNKRPNYVYMPFGIGPRNCIGMRMGQMQIRVGIAHIMANFSVHFAPSTPNSLQMDPSHAVLTPRGDLPLLFKKLKPFPAMKQ
ncbi:cytochrome P450 6k1-like [Schistocerca cancellata]|uniref:cytochrome P450 6k1-like n=1 Tax=Schistocerca cancellata TaxID=274614 RepID=UPI0021190553|nr:cytochrome P450 6k1-like [Schistocerca cancellata]